MNPNFDRPFTFDRVVRIIIGLLVLVFSFILLRELSGVLIPFFIAWLLAYLLNPLVRFVQYKMGFKNRIVSVLFSLFTISLVVIGLMFLVVPAISAEIVRMTGLVKTYASSHYNALYVPDEWENFLKDKAGLLEVQSLFSKETLMIVIEKVMPEFWHFFSNSINFLISLLVIFVVVLYVVFILLDFEKISKGWVQMVPDKWRPISQKVLLDVEDGMNRYFRGQATIALIVGVLFAVGFKIIDLPLAIGLGLFIGFLNLVPYLQIIGFIPVTFVALLKAMDTGTSFWMIMLGIIIVFAVVQGFQDSYLVPKIMGRVTGLNPAIILLSLSIWGALFGVVGMIIALPTTTLLLSYYQHFILWEDNLHQPLDKDGRSSDDTNYSI